MHNRIDDGSYPDFIDYLVVTGEDRRVYHIHFYKNKYARYVALCSTVGCSEVFGEGATWDSALAECMQKVLHSKKDNLGIDKRVLIEPEEYAFYIKTVDAEVLSNWLDAAIESGDGFYHSRDDDFFPGELVPIQDIISELSRRCRNVKPPIKGKKKG